MTVERKKSITLSFGIIFLMLVCAVLSLRRFPHHDVFRLVFDALMLLNFWIFYPYNLQRRQQDTLIRLFPASPETKERS